MGLGLGHRQGLHYPLQWPGLAGPLRLLRQTSLVGIPQCLPPALVTSEHPDSVGPRFVSCQHLGVLGGLGQNMPLICTLTPLISLSWDSSKPLALSLMGTRQWRIMRAAVDLLSPQIPGLRVSFSC